MKMPTTDPVFNAIALVLTKCARPMINDYSLNRNNCIACCRIVVDVFKRFGYEAGQCPIETIVFNPAASRKIAQGQKMPESANDIKGWCEPPEGEVYGAVTVGSSPDGKERECGHMAVHCKGWLFDISIDQADKPAIGVRLDPVMVKCSNDFLLRGMPLVLEMNGCLLAYRLRADYRNYLQSPDWNSNQMIAPFTNQIIRMVKRAIADPSFLENLLKEENENVSSNPEP